MPKWRKPLLFLGCALPWLLVLGLMLRPAHECPPPHGLTHGKPGPWGQLHAVEFEMNAPEKVSLDLCRTNLAPWFFGSTSSREQLAAIFKQAGCTAEQSSELLAIAQPQSNGWSVNPSLELRLALSNETRAHLNFHLSEFPENLDQYYAIRWAAGEFGKWLHNAKLQEETKKWFERLTYSDGTNTYFSSEPTVTRLATDDAEKIRICEALLLTRSLNVKLQIGPGADVEGLIRYWGTGGREREVRPLLEAIARLPQGGEIDIANLLPSAAETLLYTYPRLEEPYIDCHWTAFNFFHPSPERKPLGVKDTGEVYARLFTPFIGELRFGDLVLFNNAAGCVQHSAVYIADDILFTKNGKSPKKPWVLMRLSDVQNIFWKDSKISYARRKV